MDFLFRIKENSKEKHLHDWLKKCLRSRHYEKRALEIGRLSPMPYVKADLFIDMKTQIILDYGLITHREHDVKVAERIFKRNKIKNIIGFGDKGYDSENLHEIACANGITFYASVRKMNKRSFKKEKAKRILSPEMYRTSRIGNYFRCFVIFSSKISSGKAPVILSISLPSLNIINVGIDITLNLADRLEFSSTLTFANSIFPLNLLANSSIMGDNIKHGMHHDAQKSITTRGFFVNSENCLSDISSTPFSILSSNALKT